MVRLHDHEMAVTTESQPRYTTARLRDHDRKHDHGNKTAPAARGPARQPVTTSADTPRHQPPCHPESPASLPPTTSITFVSAVPPGRAGRLTRLRAGVGAGGGAAGWGRRGGWGCGLGSARGVGLRAGVGAGGGAAGWGRRGGWGCGLGSARGVGLRAGVGAGGGAAGWGRRGGGGCGLRSARGVGLGWG